MIGETLLQFARSLEIHGRMGHAVCLMLLKEKQKHEIVGFPLFFVVYLALPLQFELLVLFFSLD